MKEYFNFQIFGELLVVTARNRIFKSTSRFLKPVSPSAFDLPDLRDLFLKIR